MMQKRKSQNFRNSPNDVKFAHIVKNDFKHLLLKFQLVLKIFDRVTKIWNF